MEMEKLNSLNKNMVSHPSHYTQGSVECIDGLKAATTGLEGIDAVCTANAIKYLWRWKFKNGIEDLNKALWYINRLIKENNQVSTVQRDGCIVCKFFDNNPTKEPCASCKGTKIGAEYKIAPGNYQAAT